MNYISGIVIDGCEIPEHVMIMLSYILIKYWLRSAKKAVE